MKRVRIYIAGPYRSRWGLPGRALNIYRAWKAARWYWRRGYEVYCSHMATAFMDAVIPDPVALAMGQRELLRCNAVAFDPDYWRVKSAGTQAEIDAAALAGIVCVPWYSEPGFPRPPC